MPPARSDETIGSSKQRRSKMSESMLKEPPVAVETETMKAAVVHSFDEPLRIEHVAKPTAGPGEIVVRIEASGLCHTDIHAAHGDWPVKPSPPFMRGARDECSRHLATLPRPWICGFSAATLRGDHDGYR